MSGRLLLVLSVLLLTGTLAAAPAQAADQVGYVRLPPLSPPTPGRAKVRVIQASVRAPVLNLSIAGGPPIASNVAFATTTGYLEVQPGRWTLDATGTNGGPSGRLAVRLAAGDVYSLLVL